MSKTVLEGLDLSLAFCAAAVLVAAVSARTFAVGPDPKPHALFISVNVFDGVSAKRIERAHVLIEGNRIKDGKIYKNSL